MKYTSIDSIHLHAGNADEENLIQMVNLLCDNRRVEPNKRNRTPLSFQITSHLNVQPSRVTDDCEIYLRIIAIDKFVARITRLLLCLILTIRFNFPRRSWC